VSREGGIEAPAPARSDQHTGIYFWWDALTSVSSRTEDGRLLCLVLEPSTLFSCHVYSTTLTVESAVTASQRVVVLRQQQLFCPSNICVSRMLSQFFLPTSG
jgi:hypothetical protein